MIENNECKILITRKNVKYYNNRYLCKVGDIIFIDINMMSKNSHNKIVAICESCGNKKELPYFKYNSNKGRQGYYSCKKCSHKKGKITTMEKYGVENYTQTDVMREINKKWMSSDEFKERSKRKIIEKYGVDSYSKTNEFKKIISEYNKQRIKKLKEEGLYDCPFTWKGNKELRDAGMINKYGTHYSYYVPEIIEKRQETIRKRQENLIKCQKSSKYKGITYDPIEYKIYKNKIRVLTEKIRKKVFENWNGYDYYDNEYIKNLALNYNSENYPTIDHKISCLYGFLNNISVEEISNMNNLCITKRKINGTKSGLTELEFNLDNT